MDSLSLFFHFTFTINFCGVVPRTELSTINFSGVDTPYLRSRRLTLVESYTPYLRYRRLTLVESYSYPELSTIKRAGGRERGRLRTLYDPLFKRVTLLVIKEIPIKCSTCKTSAGFLKKFPIKCSTCKTSAGFIKEIPYKHHFKGNSS